MSRVALLLLRKYWPVAVVVLLLGAARVHAAHSRAAHRADVARADSLARVETRDSIAEVAAAQVAAATAARATAEAALRTARAAQAADARYLQRVIAGRAATDSLYAREARLTAAARTDSTVRAVVDAAHGVAVENDTLKATASRLLVHTAEVERRSDERHTADTAAIRGLAGTVVTVRDSLALEARRPKRTKKAVALAAGMGAATTTALHVAWHLLKHRIR